MAASIELPPPELIQNGYYIIGGNKYTRASNIAKIGEDTEQLTDWKLRGLAEALTGNPTLLDRLNNLEGRALNTAINAILDDAGLNATRDLGTAIHHSAEQVVLGQKDLAAIPDHHRPKVEHYLKLLEIHGLTLDTNHIEQVVFNEHYGIAGTIDSIARDHNKTPYIGDLKTGPNWRKYSVKKTSVSLAIYAAHTHTYDHQTQTIGDRITDLNVKTGFVFHIPSDGSGGAIYEIDLEEGHESWMRAMEERESANRGRRKNDGTARLYSPNLPLRAEQRAWLDERRKAVVAAGPEAIKHLLTGWPEGLPRPLPEYPTFEQVDAAATAFSVTEAAFEIPFGPGKPGAPKPKAARKKTVKKSTRKPKQKAKTS